MSDENTANVNSQENHVNKVISWKEWKNGQQELHKKWKEQRLIKKLEKKRKREEEDAVKLKQEEELKIKRNNGRNYTVSIAVPGSILDNAQTMELQTLLAGQIARAATIFNVDEIIVYDETCSLTKSEKNVDMLMFGDKDYCNIRLLRIFQYLECPQYLRKDLIPLHPDLKFSGLLNPLDAPHHLRVTDECEFREGIVTNRQIKEGNGSYVRVGLKKEVRIDKALEAGTRVTVRLEPKQENKKHLKGMAVSPSVPRSEAGIYWGFSVRLASSLSATITECPFKDGYDAVVGTSDKGDNVDKTKLSPFKHMLIIFGGLKGIEAGLESDELLNVQDPRLLFHYYINTCPNQGSRTIRTEEAILISLTALRRKILKCQK